MAGIQTSHRLAAEKLFSVSSDMINPRAAIPLIPSHVMVEPLNGKKEVTYTVDVFSTEDVDGGDEEKPVATFNAVVDFEKAKKIRLIEEDGDYVAPIMKRQLREAVSSFEDELNFKSRSKLSCRDRLQRRVNAGGDAIPKMSYVPPKTFAEGRRARGEVKEDTPSAGVKRTKRATKIALDEIQSSSEVEQELTPRSQKRKDDLDHVKKVVADFKERMDVDDIIYFNNI